MRIKVELASLACNNASMMRVSVSVKVSGRPEMFYDEVIPLDEMRSGFDLAFDRVRYKIKRAFESGWPRG